MSRFLLLPCILLSLLCGATVRSQEPPAAEPPPVEPTGPDGSPTELALPTPGEPAPDGPDGEAAPIGSTGPGTASGPPPLGNETPAPEAAPTEGQAPAGGMAATATNPRASTATFPTDGVDATADEPYLYMGLGMGLIFIVGVGVVWGRGERSDETELPEGVIRLAQPPFISAPIPSLSEGIQVWSVEPDQHAMLLADLLATLADSHRVLVVCPVGQELPPVAGGPVYRVDGLRPVHLEDPVDALLEDGGRSPMVLFVLPSEYLSTMGEFADTLPPGVGGICLVTETHELPFPSIVSRAVDDGWSLQRGEQRFSVRRTLDGRLLPEPRGARS